MADIRGRNISNKEVQLSYATYDNMRKRVENYKKKYKKNPKRVYIFKNGTDYVLYSTYSDMVARMTRFYKENKRWSSKVWIKRPVVTKKAVVKVKEWYLTAKFKYQKQSTSYNCAPASFAIAISEFGMDVSQDKLAKWMGTGVNGTGHPGITAAAKKLGLGIQFKDFDSITVKQWQEIAENPKKAAMFHFQVTDDGVAYDGKTVIYQTYRKGHYETYIGINNKTKEIRVADPDREIIEYSFTRIRNSAKATEKKFMVGSVCILTKP